MTQPSADQITAVLNSSVQAPLEGVFQIALVLGGTVSTGAYTAGFLDKLIEALDAWYGAKEDETANVPRHEVRLRVAAGASGGGVSAALLARMLPFGIMPLRPEASDAVGKAHLLYDTWVNQLDIGRMVDLTDLAKDVAPRSVLNGGGIKDAVKTAETYVGPALPHAWAHRPYVDNPFRVILTLGNLTGVPHAVEFEGGKKHAARTHADYARFACDITAPNNPPLALRPRPDEFFVQTEGWDRLGSYAAGGAAFPLALPPYLLTRPRAHYDYRAVVVPGEKATAQALPLRPLWPDTDADADATDYSFLTVDGGTFNNEPIELARTYLAGLTGRNPRDGGKSDRAVVLVDPFPDRAELGKAEAEDVFKQGGATLGGFLSQSRFSTSDMLLMADPTVFSRFLVTPHRGKETGEKALAGGALQGFIGFFHKKFRHHDYMLGRANCLKFLEEDFVLYESNPLFQGGRWTEAQKLKYGTKAGAGYLPIIPLVGTAAEPDADVAWPSGILTPSDVSDRLKPRLKAVISHTADGTLDFPLSDLLIALLKGVGAKFVLGKIEAAAKADFKTWSL